MSLLDDLVKHKILVQRLTKGQAKILLAYVKKAQSLAIKNLETKNLDYLEKKLGDILRGGIDESVKALAAIAAYESLFIIKILKKYGLDAKRSNKIRDKVGALKVPMVTGGDQHSIEKSYAMFSDKKANDFTRVISATSEKSNPERVTAIDLLVTGLITWQLTTLSRTTINAVTEEVHKDEYKSNGVYQVQWVALLDGINNVCPYCEDRNELIFQIGDPDIKDFPPHANCKCDLIPVFIEDRP